MSFRALARDLVDLAPTLPMTRPCSENRRRLLISHPPKTEYPTSNDNRSDLPIFVLGGLLRRRAAAGVVSSALRAPSPGGRRISMRRRRADTSAEIPLPPGEGGRRPGEGRVINASTASDAVSALGVTSPSERIFFCA